MPYKTSISNDVLSPKLITQFNIQISQTDSNFDLYTLAESLSKKPTFSQIKDIILRTCHGNTSEAQCFLGTVLEEGDKYNQEYIVLKCLEKIEYILKHGSNSQKQEALFLGHLIIGTHPIKSWIAYSNALDPNHWVKTELTDELQERVLEFRNTILVYNQDEKEKTINKVRSNISTLYTDISDNTLKQELSSFPEQDIWRLYVDGIQQLDENELGWYHYESREPNSLMQVNEAQVLALKNVNAPLDLDLIKKLHSIIREGVSGEFNNIDSYRGSQTYYHVREFTPLGLLEQNETMDIRQFLNEKYTIADMNGLSLKIKYKQLHEFQIDEKIQTYLKEYEDNLLKIKLMDSENEQDIAFEKLKAITKLIVSLDRLHPYYDGNGRLFQNVLLNRELIRHGFSPAIMANPNYLDILCLEESMLYICQGMANFQYVKQHGVYPGSNRTTQDYKKDIENKYGVESAQRFTMIPDMLKPAWEAIVKLSSEPELSEKDTAENVKPKIQRAKPSSAFLQLKSTFDRQNDKPSKDTQSKKLERTKPSSKFSKTKRMFEEKSRDDNHKPLLKPKK